MPKASRYARSQDAARLAEEKASKPPRRAPVPPRSRARKVAAPAEPTTPEPTPAAPRKASKKTQAKKRGRPRKKASEKRPRKPRAKREPPTIAEEVFGSGPPAKEPELDAAPKDAEGKPLSHLWDLARANYRPKVQQFVDALMRRNRLELDDLIYLEFAEHGELSAYLTEPGNDTKRVREALSSTMLQSRKQMARLLVARGPIGGVNDVPVRVPEGLDLASLTLPPDEGDDVLARPSDASLPEQFR